MVKRLFLCGLPDKMKMLKSSKYLRIIYYKNNKTWLECQGECNSGELS